MIVDGKKIAQEIIAGIGDSLRGRTLGVVMSEGDKTTESFVKIKTRVAERLGVEIVRCSAREMQKALACDGVIVQLPIPNADALIAQIPPEKDIDALNPKTDAVRAPVAEAVVEIFARAGIDPKNKKAVVVGEGRLVGKPVAEMLRTLGAEVVVVSLKKNSLAELQDADIVVSGAGSPGLIKPTMLKKEVVLIDAGTSEQGGKVAGDCDPACAEVASFFTPVPGGVGPVAVAMIFKNLSVLARPHDGLARIADF